MSGLVAPSRMSIFIAFFTLSLSFLFGLSDVLAQSSCVACHTEENMLEMNLSQEKEKKSALTSGAG